MSAVQHERRISRMALFYGVIFVIAALWAAAQQRNLLMRSDLDAKHLILHIVLGLSVGLGIAKGSQKLSMTYLWARRLEGALAEAMGPLSSGEILLLASLSALGEEALFRGAMQPELGLVVTSLAFGLLHVGPGREFLPWTAMAIGAGFLFGAMAMWTGNLIAPILAHASINYVNLRRLSKDYPLADEPGDL